MASFLDQVPQFTPYVPQLPVEAMVKVGMAKQAQYEQGVQKIQSQIDQIAGLDIIKPEDKNYLQSKLNELGTNLTMFAAGDFSNFQLVNSVAGMTKQIVRDPNVQTAVASTAMYKKETALQESLRKEGKNGTSNDWLFNYETNEWLNDGKVASKYNVKYQPYTNWKKNALDVIKNLTGDSTITDNAFTTDANGNLVIADAIVRKKMAGISPEKIQQALVSALSPNDFKQMEIDGRYNYSNVDDNVFLGKVYDSYNDRINFFQKQKFVLENAKLSTNSVIEKDKLDEQISAMDRAIKKMTDEYESVTSTVKNGDAESAKAKLFTIDQLTGFSKAFSHTEISQTYENSPFADMQMRREVKEMEWRKFLNEFQQRERFQQQDLAEKRLDRRIRLSELEESREANRLKKQELEGYGGLPGPVDPSMVTQYNVPKFTDEVQKGLSEIQKIDYDFVKNVLMPPGGAMGPGAIEDFITYQRDAWEKNPKSVDPRIAQHFRSTEELRRRVENDQQVLIDVNTAVKQQYGTIEDLIPKGSKSVIYTSSNREKFTYSPRDFVEYNRISRNYINVRSSGGTGGAGVSVSYDFAAAKKELSPKLYNLFLVESRYADPTNKNLPPQGDKLLMEYARWYNTNVNIPWNSKLSEISATENTLLNQKLTTNQGVMYGVPTTNAAQKSSIANVLFRLADLAEKTGGGLANSPNFKPATAKQLALEDANYSLTVVEGTERQPAAYQLTVSGKAGTVSARLTPEQKISVFGQTFEASPAVQAIRPYQEQIRKTGGYSTAPRPTEPTTQYNSYLSSIDFPNIDVYGVKGNLITLGADPTKPGSSLYTIKLAVFDPISKTWKNDISFPRSGVLSEEAVAPAMAGFNDAVIYELLNEKPATANDINQLKSASKKPL